MNRITVGIATGLIFLVRFIGGGSSGFSIQWTHIQTHVSGGTSPWAIATAVMMLVLFWLIHDEDVPQILSAPAKTSQRAVASFVDVTVTFFGGMGILGIIPATIEWLWTSTFEFYFIRTFVRWTDFVVLIVFFALWSIVLVLYFGNSLRKGRQTLGSYIAGVVVIPTDPKTVSTWRILGRALVVYAAAIGFPITLLRGRDREGKFWHDRLTNFKVVRTQSRRLSNQD